MTGPTPSFGSLGDVSEHPAENRSGVSSKIVRFIAIHPLYPPRPGSRHTSLCGARPGPGEDARCTASFGRVAGCQVPYHAFRVVRAEHPDRSAASPPGDFRAEQPALGAGALHSLHQSLRTVAAEPPLPVTLLLSIH